MKITIHVTNDVIKQAEAWRGDVRMSEDRRSGWIYSCVISRAIREHLHDDAHVSVAGHYANICGTKIVLPEEAAQVAFAFDECQPITPMSFEADLPEIYLNEYAKDGLDPIQPTQAEEVERVEVLASAK